MQQMEWRNNGSYRFSDKYEICTLDYVVNTYRLHVDDMFDEMHVMDSRDPFKVLNKYFL